MATEVNNQATVNYTYSGSTATLSETSNVSTVNVLASSALSILKYSSNNSFVPGGTITYYIEIENQGSQYFSGVRINDDLGGTPRYLTYINNSATLYINGQVLQAQVASTNPLVFTLSPLPAGGRMVLSYMVNVSSTIPASVNTITNTAEGIGYTFNSQVTDYSTYEISRTSGADVIITKTASEDTVSLGQIYSYTITMANTGTATANVSSVTDELPTNFNVASVQLKIGNGPNLNLDSTDYTIGQNNQFTLPSSTGPAITIPPANSTGNGTTIVTINGYLSE